MLRKITLVMLGLVLSLLISLPVVAAAPAEGLVVEGVSVPGVNLGDTRAQVEASYGEPHSCQNLPYYNDQPGLNGICYFDVESGGQVTILYKNASGGPAENAADDVVFNIRWPEAVSGWVTTAGVNTTLALADPQAVIDLYPDAVVTYNPLFGNIESIQEYSLGILIDYSFDYLSGRLSVTMAISFPGDPPPAPEKITKVTDIELTVTKVKRDRQVRALVRVENEYSLAASEAAVFATWIFPDGSTLAVEDLTSDSGYAYFELHNVPKGALTLRVDDVILEGYRFDRENSVLSARATVR